MTLEGKRGRRGEGEGRKGEGGGEGKARRGKGAGRGKGEEEGKGGRRGAGRLKPLEPIYAHNVPVITRQARLTLPTTKNRLNMAITDTGVGC